MNLDLTPNELMRTSRYALDRAAAYQQAKARGIADVQNEHRKAKDREAQQQAALKKLRG